MSTEQETASVEAVEAVDETPETPAAETTEPETAEATIEETEEAPVEEGDTESAPEADTDTQPAVADSPARPPAGPVPIEAPSIDELPDDIIDDFEAAIAHTVLEFNEGDIVVGTVVS